MRGVTRKGNDFLCTAKFLLTRLMRGVTLIRHHQMYLFAISTHTPHARRDIKKIPLPAPTGISTHTPHARRDNPINTHVIGDAKFLLTRLMRGVTCIIRQTMGTATISTHTPHARRDMNFGNVSRNDIFLLTRLMRGVTKCYRY